jgi:hypothetical protein
MLELLMAAALAGAPPQQAEPAQDPPPYQQAPLRLEDVEVIGRPLDTMIRNFVDHVGAPVYRRNLARWNEGVCVGVANLKGDTAQYIADRVSTVAEDLGLRPGGPGCRANIMVIAAADPSGLASTLIERSPRNFRPGGPGMELGRTRLRAFQDSDRPVRWWSISLPMDSHTGQLAVRIPGGDCQHPCDTVDDFAPVIYMTTSSRISTQIVDNLARVIVIVDAGKLEGITTLQLADYIAMVSLAQIDSEADTRAYASILNLFEDPEITPSLSDWDLAYLQGLYSSQRAHRLPGANRAEVAASIRRVHRRMQQGVDN